MDQDQAAQRISNGIYSLGSVGSHCAGHVLYIGYKLTLFGGYHCNTLKANSQHI